MDAPIPAKGAENGVAAPAWPSPRRARIALILLMAGLIVSILDRGVINLLVEPIKAEYGLSDTQFGALQSIAFATFYVLMAIPIGVLADRYQRRLIVAIGEWVIREACATLAGWRRAGIDQVLMSVNVSAVQLLRSDLARTVQRALDDTGVPANQLELELTESVLMANAEHATARLQTFRRLGVSIAVDDFGTGYSSLAYLRRLPITTLKIDKAFIDDLSRPGDNEDAAITTTVIAMAHSLGLRVVAEGVETLEQQRFLLQHGCDMVQGYLLSPPLDGPDCLRFLQDWQERQSACLDPAASPP